MRLRTVLLYLPMLGLAGLAGWHSLQPSEARPLVEQAATTGEVADYRVDGETVYVGNRLCAVSRSPLDPSTLGQFTSTVTYEGSDPRFVGKELVFNQCCEMCIERFPAMWAQDAEAILRFHGLG